MMAPDKSTIPHLQLNTDNLQLGDLNSISVTPEQQNKSNVSVSGRSKSQEDVLARLKGTVKPIRTFDGKNRVFLCVF